jgi:SAM-dependent methyltransferase
VRRRFIDDLVCPISRDPLTLAAVGVDDGDVIDTGELVCAGCGARWPIRGGVPRLVPPDLPEAQQRTADAFAAEWLHFDEMHPEFEEQFLDWLHPLDRTFFEGKRVLDAGCGTGRHAYYAARFGASEVVALELGDSIETARRVLAPFENVDVVQADLLRPPVCAAAEGGGFDFVYAIGVLHHLPIPYDGFRALLPLVRPGGTIAVWVYGHENNGFVRHVVEPVRRGSTRIPPPLLRGLAWPAGAAFHLLAKGVYKPLEGTNVGRALPLSEYLAHVGNFSFRQNYAIVFDQLVAPTSAYIKGPELQQWFDENGLVDVALSHRHGNSWRGRGRVPA